MSGPTQQSFSSHRDDQSPLLGTSPYLGPEPFFRDALDAARSMWRHTPESSYPDGYVESAMTGRRQDRIGAAVWRNQKAYSRGVHKGERIDMSDYLWPSEFNLASGIVNQMRSNMRYVSPAFTEEPVALVNDGKPGPHDFGLGDRTPVPIIPDPNRAAQLRRLAPHWN